MIRKALDLVEEGRIGKVLAVDILRSSDYPAYSGGPLPKLVTQGSYPFRDLGVHGLYTIEAFAGEVSGLEVSCSSTGANPSLQFDERSEEHTSELQSLMRISYAVFCLKNKKNTHIHSE